MRRQQIMNRTIIKLRANCQRKRSTSRITSSKVQLLADENKRVRLQILHQLHDQLATTILEKIVFTNKNIFTVEQVHNRQNDISSSIESQYRTPQKSAIRHGLVWNLRERQDTPSFCETRGQIGKEMYRLRPINTSAIKNGPSNRTRQRQSIGLKQCSTSAEWPPYSPDLNPIDYSKWSIWRPCPRLSLTKV